MADYHYVQLRVRHVKCIDETTGWGSDDIAIGGIAIYHDFKLKLISPVSLGEFHEGSSRNVYKKLVGMSMKGGDSKFYPVKIPGTSVQKNVKLFYFNPGKTYYVGSSPVKRSKFVSAILFLAEKDVGGGFKSFLYDTVLPVVRSARNKAKADFTTKLAAGTLDITDMSAIILSKYITRKKLVEVGFAAITAGGAYIGDDISFPVIVRQEIASYGYFPNGRRDTDNRSYYFNPAGILKIGFDGKYRLRLDWKKYN